MIKNYASAQPHAFVGRKKELADLNARLVGTECRLLTITGLGGGGKTRLALEAAQQTASHFQHGVVFVNLQKITRSTLLVHTIAQALNLSLYGEAEPEAQLIHYLREKSLLLLLDNFEHLLDGSSLVSTLLADAPNIKILATSREALSLQEEWVYHLKGMSVPLSTYTMTLEDYEAVQLFMHHARRAQPGFEMETEREPVIQICTMTAGLPLALELAASWLKGLTASQIASEMRHNLDFLSTTMRNIEERHRSMRAVFDHSWKLLSEQERTIFAGMSVFRGSFDSEAAKQVTGASLQILAGLVEKSLVQMEISNRFSIHEMLRQYGMERLEEHGESTTLHERHCQYYSALMLEHETALKQPDQMETLRSIENDFENFRLAWDWATESRRVHFLNMMLHGLYLFGFLRSRYRETIAIFQHALEQDLPDTVLRGRLLVRRWGYLQWWYERDYQAALDGIYQSLEVATEADHPFEIAFSHLMVAYAMIGMQHYTEALPHLETSHALFQTIQEPYYVCWVLHRLGYVYSNLNDSVKATEYTEQSLSLARVAHNCLAMVACLYNLGSDYILQGHYAKGRNYCEESLHVASETGHQGQIAHALSMVAACAFFQGEFETCRELTERSQAIIEDINLLAFQAYNLALLIVLACIQGDLDEGVRSHELAKRHSTNVMGYQLLYWSLAILSSGLGNLEATRLHIRKLIEINDSDANPALLRWVVPAAAFVFSERDPAQAVELCSFAWNRPGTELGWVRLWPQFQQLQTRLQHEMDTQSYDAHWEAGKTLAFERIGALLCGEFGTDTEPSVEPLPKELLTTRENEILQLLAAGLTKPQIAEALVIGTGTVKTHTLNIYRKLEVANRTQAIARAQTLHLLPTTNSH